VSPSPPAECPLETLVPPGICIGGHVPALGDHKLHLIRSTRTRATHCVMYWMYAACAIHVRLACMTSVTARTNGNAVAGSSGGLRASERVLCVRRKCKELLGGLL
jgi:hypothetical protein